MSQPATALRAFMLAVSGIGVSLLLALLLVSFLSPTTIESWARTAVRHEVQKRVEDRLAALDQSSLVQAATRALAQNDAELATVKERLAREIPAQIAALQQRMLDPACECRARAREIHRQYLQGRLGALSQAHQRLQALITSKYVEVTDALVREFRIFCAANALVFLCLGAVAWRRQPATLQLLAPAVVLLGAAALVAGSYLFSQNWLLTLLLGNYVGLWYFPYLGLAIAFMADIVFNRARITTLIVNAAAHVVGSAAAAVPC